jgi:hypothetical protein
MTFPMPRPERPVEGHGPVQDLARELRRIRDQAGTPGYREMSEAVKFSRETLSAAARGASCPAWEVTRAFAEACDPTGAAGRRIRPLWDVAEKASRRRRPAGRRRPAAAAPRPAGPARPSPADCQPRPDPGWTPAQFIHGLRGLRAWAGNPGWDEASQRLGRWWDLPSSTMYDALSPKRTTLPPLRTARKILMACLDDMGDVDDWVRAWQAISHREFARINPMPHSEPADGAQAPLRIVSSQ